MKFRNIFWGIILILIGVLFTLDNLHFIDFDWYNLWRLWPVVLILWGISVLPVKNLIKVILVLLVLAGSITYMMNTTVYWHERDYHISYDNDDREIDQDFTIPFEDSIETAKLDMEVAASRFILIDESYSLLDFEKKGSIIDYKYAVRKTDNSIDIDIYIEDEVVLKSNSHNRIDMSLNPYPVWDMHYEVGAADVDFDFSGLKISNLTLEGGAAAIRIKLGDDYPETKVNIEAGASSIKVKVPESSGCDLNITSVLSGKNISGFEKIDHGHYRTENFEDADTKIYLVVEAAVSSYSIIRY
jgi:cell wall-active antibiotic response 4TMS protein YvqF